MNPSQLEALVQRLERIERENAALRWIGSAMFLGLVVMITAGSGLVGRQPWAVERLELKDQQGKVRASLALEADGTPKLAFRDSQGVERMVLEAREHRTRLELYAGGRLQASLESNSDGSSALQLFDKDRNAPSSFDMWPEGTTGMLLSGRNAPLHLVAKANGPTKLSVLDQAFEERAALRLTPGAKLDWELIPRPETESRSPTISTRLDLQNPSVLETVDQEAITL